jgi:hypothetical protein
MFTNEAAVQLKLAAKKREGYNAVVGFSPLLLFLLTMPFPFETFVHSASKTKNQS